MYAHQKSVIDADLNPTKAIDSRGFAVNVPMNVPMSQRVLQVRFKMLNMGEEVLAFYKWASEQQFNEQVLKSKPVQDLSTRFKLEAAPQNVHTVFLVDISQSMEMDSTALAQRTAGNLVTNQVGDVLEGIYKYLQGRKAQMPGKQ